MAAVNEALASQACGPEMQKVAGGLNIPGLPPGLF